MFAGLLPERLPKLSNSGSWEILTFGFVLIWNETSYFEITHKKEVYREKIGIGNNDTWYFQNKIYPRTCFFPALLLPLTEHHVKPILGLEAYTLGLLTSAMSPSTTWLPVRWQ